jgi:hypothetical protein
VSRKKFDPATSRAWPSLRWLLITRGSFECLSSVLLCVITIQESLLGRTQIWPPVLSAIFLACAIGSFDESRREP